MSKLLWMLCFKKCFIHLCLSLRCVLLPLLSCKAPSQSLFVLVDSVDEGCLSGDRDQRSANIAELLAAHHELFPPWLLLVCSARRQNKHITKLFTGDDLYLNLASEPECWIIRLFLTFTSLIKSNQQLYWITDFGILSFVYVCISLFLCYFA